MRTFLLALSLMLVSACQCGVREPTAVMLRIANRSSDAIYVDSTDGRLGLSVQRELAGSYYTFDDRPCECQFCSNICRTSCVCLPPGERSIFRVGADASVERSWNGIVQVAEATSCQEGACLSQEVPTAGEVMRAQLCYSRQRPQGVAFDDGGVGFGEFQKSGQVCLHKSFRAGDSVVELGPNPEPSCAESSECQIEGALCLAGACTTACPPNDFPAYGSNWSLYVASPDNMGFFTEEHQGTLRMLTGTGVVSAAIYQGSSLQLHLTRPGSSGEAETAAVTLQFPAAHGVPLVSGMPVSIVMIDEGGSPPNRAIVVRDSVTSRLLFAADMAQGQALLSNAELAPFSISVGTTARGCSHDSCGKQIYYRLTVSRDELTVAVDPGSMSQLVAPDGTYELLNVTTTSYDGATSCKVAQMHPYILYRRDTTN